MMHKIKDKTDLSVLDEIIEMCEESMVRPFSKKKKAVIIAGDGEDMGMEHESEHDEDEKKEDISDEDLEQLIEEYKRRKGD
jgi:hypothetical protein